MPIEIKELIIKATVTGEGEASASPAAGPGSEAGAGSKEEKLVQRCVEQVMEILRIQSER